MQEDSKMADEDKILTGILTKERLKPLLPFLENNEITDIDWHGNSLWVNTIHNESVRIPDNEHSVTSEYIDGFVSNIANSQSKYFNKQNYKLEAESEELCLRITCLHESVAKTGTSVFIRKTTKETRFSYDSLIKSGYCSKDTLNLLINAVQGKLNIVICGEPEAGKTEFGKFLSMYIPDNEHTVTIEDTLEWHYKDLKPEASHTSLQVNEVFTYTDALKECMRINPKRILLSEVRSVEAKNLIELWNTGSKGITTLHTDDVRKIPDRMLNMMPTRLDAERLRNNIYENLDIGILIRRKKVGNVIQRYIDQIACFSRIDEENLCRMILEDGRLVNKKLPADKMSVLGKAGIDNPFIWADKERK